MRDEAALAELSSEDREIVTLKHLEGLSYDQLSERLEIPVGTVMSRLHRGRKKIREQLRRTGVAPTHDDLEIGRQR